MLYSKEKANHKVGKGNPSPKNYKRRVFQSLVFTRRPWIQKFLMGNTPPGECMLHTLSQKESLAPG